jgi:hypothetical protein
VVVLGVAIEVRRGLDGLRGVWDESSLIASRPLQIAIFVSRAATTTAIAIAIATAAAAAAAAAALSSKSSAGEPLKSLSSVS